MREIRKIPILILSCFILVGCSNEEIVSLKHDGDGMPSEGFGQVTDLPDVSLKKNVMNELYYEDVYKKTLFNPERSFIESENSPDEDTSPTPTKQAAIDLPNLDLIGTLKTSDNMDYAFIRNSGAGSKNASNMVMKYTLGQWIGDYLVTKIEASRVTLMKGQEVAIIRLKPSGKPAGKPVGAQGRRSGESGPHSGSKQNEKKSEAEVSGRTMCGAQMKADFGSESIGTEKAEGQEPRTTRRRMPSGGSQRF